MLAGDSRSAWDSNVLNDPRVVQFWDRDRIIGRWLADHKTGGIGSPGDVVWDAYFAYPAGSTWTNEPSGLLAAGSDIISNTGGLTRAFSPLLP
jgi:hypothetical protein